MELGRIWELLRKYGLSALWVLSLPLLIWGGFVNPEAVSGDPSYPFGFVLLFALLTLLETGLLYLILRPNSFRRSWGRVIIALIVFTPISVAARSFDEVPGYFDAHALWLAVVVRLLALTLIITVFFAVRHFQRTRRERKEAERRQRSRSHR